MNNPKTGPGELSIVYEDGKHRTEWWDVGAGMYELIEIGDYVFKECGAIRVEKEE